MKSIKKILAVILSMTLMLTLGTAAFGAQKLCHQARIQAALT